MAIYKQEFDTLRDRAAGVRRDMETLARSVGERVVAAVRRAVSDSRTRETRRRRVLEELGEQGRRYEALLDEYTHLEHLMDPENDGGPAWYLYTATREWLPVLRQEGVSFAGMLAPDGVLGEYQTEDRSITLFAPMIELAAREVARELSMSPPQVEPLVRTVVEIHELSHAHAHLGRDADDAIWSTPDKDTANYHEALAQAYTRKLVAVLGRETPNLEEVLRVLERWLPAEYHHSAHLLAADPEALRSYVVKRRSRAPVRTQAQVAEAILKGLPGYARMMRDHALVTDSAAVLRALDRVVGALDEPSGVPEALDGLLAALGGLPQAETMLGAFVPGGWPSAEERRWLLFEALTAGEAVGKRPLRWIRQEDVVRAVAASRSAEEVGLRPALRSSREAIAEVISLRQDKAQPATRETTGSKRAAGGRKRRS